MKAKIDEPSWADLMAVLRTEVVPALAAIQTTLLRSQLPAQPEFASVNEALCLLHVSRTQLYRLFRSGDLTPVKRGRTTLIHRDDLKHFVNQLREKARR